MKENWSAVKIVFTYKEDRDAGHLAGSLVKGRMKNDIHESKWPELHGACHSPVMQGKRKCRGKKSRAWVGTDTNNAVVKGYEIVLDWVK